MLSRTDSSPLWIWTENRGLWRSLSSNSAQTNRPATIESDDLAHSFQRFLPLIRFEGGAEAECPAFALARALPATCDPDSGRAPPRPRRSSAWASASSTTSTATGSVDSRPRADLGLGCRAAADAAARTDQFAVAAAPPPRLPGHVTVAEPRRRFPRFFGATHSPYRAQISSGVRSASRKASQSWSAGAFCPASTCASASSPSLGPRRSL